MGLLTLIAPANALTETFSIRTMSALLLDLRGAGGKKGVACLRPVATPLVWIGHRPPRRLLFEATCLFHLGHNYGLRPNCTVAVCPVLGTVTVIRYVAEESGSGFVARL